MADTMPPKVRGALVGGLLLVLGLASGAFLFGGAGGVPTGPVTLTVPGAMAVSAYCGGEQTFRSDDAQPDTLTFVPAGPRCDIEAPLTPSLPLRGVLEVGRGSAYACVRDGLDLVCGLSPDQG